VAGHEPTPEPAKEERAPTCLPKNTAQSGVAHVELTGRRVTACFASDGTMGSEGGPNECLVVDLGAQKVVARKTWAAGSTEPPAPPTPEFELTTTEDSVKVCAPNDTNCKTVRVKHKPSSAGHGGEENRSLIASASPDGTRVFVFAPAAKVTYGDIYEMKTGTRIAHVKLNGLVSPEPFNDTSDIWSAELLDKSVIVRAYRCCGPGGATYALDPKLGKMQLLHTYDGDLTRVSGNVHLARDGKKHSLVDLDQLKVLGSFEAPGAGIDDPESAEARAATDSGSLVVAYGNPPGLLTIDVEKRSASSPFPLPLCP
jgi:hypothetical protein